MCPETDISATVQPIGVKFCTMIELCPGQVLSSFGSYIFRGLQLGGQNVFGQFVFGVASSFIINKIHLCVACRRLLLAGDGRRTRTCTEPWKVYDTRRSNSDRC